MYFHYTSIEVLRRIVSSRNVQMGSLVSMNDKKRGFDLNMIHVKSVTLGSQVPRHNSKLGEGFLIVNDCAGYMLMSSRTLR